MIRRLGPRAALTLLATWPLLPLAGCGLYTRPTAEDQEVRRGCDAESDRIFAARNRDQISERSFADSPNAENPLPFNPPAGLADQYEQDRLVDACLARNGAAAGGTVDSQPANRAATSAQTHP